MPGVGDFDPANCQPDPHRQSSDELVHGVGVQGVVRAFDLCGGRGQCRTPVAKRADGQGGQQRCTGVMTHGIGQGDVQVFMIEAVLEGVCCSDP